MYQRPDGLFEKSLNINGQRKVFRGKTENEIYLKIAAYEEEEKNGPLFTVIAENWKDKTWDSLSSNTAHSYTAAYNTAVEHFRSKHISSISPADIKDYVDTFIRKKFAARTVKIICWY